LEIGSKLEEETGTHSMEGSGKEFHVLPSSMICVIFVIKKSGMTNVTAEQATHVHAHTHTAPI
jgi:hypothetical protein